MRAFTLAACAIATALGGATHDPSKLVVYSPESLVAKYAPTNGSIPQRAAMFGIPANGHRASLSGTAVWVNADDIEGCNPIDRSAMNNVPLGGALIVVVERGNCTFVTKVQHAQDVGAKACIVVDNKDEAGLPYMADDGHGSSISIPSMLIHKTDGAEIAAAAKVGEVVRLTMSWNIPHPDNIVEWEFWTSSDDLSSTEFKRDFDIAAKVLGEASVMTPHYFVESGLFYGCFSDDKDAPLPCTTQCTNEGRYCAMDAEQDAERGLTGALVMEENLRQICIFNELNKTGQANTEKWWNYVENFDRECMDFSKECADRLMSADDVGVSPAAVDSCMEKSGGVGPRDGVNELLEAEMLLRYDMGIWTKGRAIIINGIYYLGNLKCPLPIDVLSCGVLAEICMGFKDQSLIAACTSSPDCKLGETKDICGVCNGSGQIDACGVCNQLGGKQFNSSCAGCNGVANSGLVVDDCGVCAGAGRDSCKRCYTKDDSRRKDDPDADCELAPSGVSTPVVVGIIIGVIVLVGIVAGAFIRHRNNALRQDIDALLKQYLPMENEGSADV